MKKLRKEDNLYYIGQSDCSPNDMPENKKFEIDNINAGIIEYYANPADHRTLEQLGKDLGVTYDTIYRRSKQWHKEIFDEVTKKRKEYLPYLVSKGYKTLEAKLSRSPKMLEMLFKMAGELIERTENSIKYESGEAKREKLAEILTKMGFKLITDSTPLNRTQLPQVESKPAEALPAPKLDKS